MTKILAVLLAVLFAAPAHADDMAFFLRNGHSRAVVVELYSQTRAKVWPGGQNVYLLEKGERKSVPIDCETGETICYGAWVNGDAGTFWGVGPDNFRSCTDCCAVCAARASATIEVGP